MPPNKHETEERVEYTAFLLQRRLYKSDVKRLLKRRYSISARACERLLKKAREQLLAGTGKTKAEHVAEALAFYESVISGPDSTLREKMLSQDRINDLLGLWAPRETRLTGKDGGAIATVEEKVVFYIPDNGRQHLPPAEGPEPAEQLPATRLRYQGPGNSAANGNGTPGGNGSGSG